MLRVAIVEDEQQAIEALSDCLNRYSAENGIDFQIRTFQSGVDFITNYRPNYDIVFMDVNMPEINGFKTAHKLRELDSGVALVFVTNLGQYAIRGYEYNALDYMLKPLKYPSFALKIKKVVASCVQQQGNDIVIPTSNGQIRISSASVIYVESSGHNIVYHTKNGDYNAYGTMKKVEEILPKTEFYRCNSGYIVNLRYVTKIDGYKVILGDAELMISHPRRKQFVEALHNYYR